MHVPAFANAVYTKALAGMNNAADIYTGASEIVKNGKYVFGNASMLFAKNTQQKGIAGSVNSEASGLSAELTSMNAFLVLVAVMWLGNSCLQFGNAIMRGYTVTVQAVVECLQHVVTFSKFVYTDMWIPILWHGILRPCVGMIWNGLCVCMIMIWNGMCVPLFYTVIYPALVDMKQLVQNFLAECWIAVKQFFVENVIDPLKKSYKDFVDMIHACIMSIFV
jgi:ribosomal protein L30E